MKNFSTVFRGYNKEEVKQYLDNVIVEYERLLNSKKEADKKIDELNEKLEYYKNIESRMNHAIFNAETAGDDIKKMARRESENLINEARRNANRIINDALIKAEKASETAERLKRNVKELKRKLRTIIEGQLEVIEEMDKLDMKNDDY